MIKNETRTNFILFSNCIPVKGQKRSIICDFEKHTYFFIPNSLFDILKDDKEKTVNEIIEKYGKEFEKTILEYFEYLIQNDVLIKLEKNELQYFPPLNLKWDFPAHISNAIIDYNKDSNYDIENICKQLSFLNCKGVQLRMYNYENYTKLNIFLEFFDKHDINSVELLIPYTNKWSEKEFNNLRIEFPIIKQIIIHSAPHFHINNTHTIIYLKQQIINSNYCGNINPNYFTTNIHLFTEAQNHNTCLNRKISIDVNGEIKNCPAMKKSYGNIKDTKLEESLDTEGFKDLWFINKDKIKVCKDCEFRYICTDCRAFITDENNIYSKPAKCKYNPYTAEFEK